MFWAQNITHLFAYNVISWSSGRGRDGRVEKEKREIGAYQNFFFSILSPGWRFGLVVVVPGRRVVIDSHRQLCCELTHR